MALAASICEGRRPGRGIAWPTTGALPALLMGSQSAPGGFRANSSARMENWADGGSPWAAPAKYVAAAAEIARTETRQGIGVGIGAGFLLRRGLARRGERLEDLDRAGAALDPDGVDLAPDKRAAGRVMVVSEAMMVVPKNLLAPSSREARFTVSPITV